MVAEEIEPKPADARPLKRPPLPANVAVWTDNFVSKAGLTALLQKNGEFQVDCVVPFASMESDFSLDNADLLLFEEPSSATEQSLRQLRAIAHKYPKLRILVLSQHPDSIYSERAFRIGAWASYIRTGTAGGLLDAIEDVLLKSVRATSNSKAKATGGARSGLQRLSDRELEVLALVSVGHGITQIARELGISRKTVETHFDHVKLKLNYASAAELKRAARRLLGTR